MPYAVVLRWGHGGCWWRAGSGSWVGGLVSLVILLHFVPPSSGNSVTTLGAGSCVLNACHSVGICCSTYVLYVF